MIHQIKCWPEFYERILLGQKTFEIRLDDRGYQKGDQAWLEEYDPNADRYTGRRVFADIGFVTGWEQKQNYVVFSLLNVREDQSRD